jgi:hydroxyacylglutathione hydrolase
MSTKPLIITLPVTELQQNCRVLIDRVSSSAVVIDPGGEARRIIALLKKESVNLSEIWLTHSHFDHCGGVAGLLRERSVPLIGHRAEREFRSNVDRVKVMYGMTSNDMENCPEPTQFVQGGETLSFGGDQYQVLFTPGHSPGHVCFYNAAAGLLLGGDTLFAGSIGRTDLPGGDHDLLLRSIRSQLLTLPPETIVMSGHGPDTSIGRERRDNPFVGGER